MSLTLPTRGCPSGPTLLGHDFVTHSMLIKPYHLQLQKSWTSPEVKRELSLQKTSYITETVQAVFALRPVILKFTIYISMTNDESIDDAWWQSHVLFQRHE